MQKRSIAEILTGLVVLAIAASFLGKQHTAHGPAIGIAPAARFPIGIAEAVLANLSAGEANKQRIEQLHGGFPGRAKLSLSSHSGADHAKTKRSASYPQDIVGPTPKNH